MRPDQGCHWGTVITEKPRFQHQFLWYPILQDCWFRVATRYEDRLSTCSQAGLDPIHNSSCNTRLSRRPLQKNMAQNCIKCCRQIRQYQENALFSVNLAQDVVLCPKNSSLSRVHYSICRSKGLIQVVQ